MNVGIGRLNIIILFWKNKGCAVSAIQKIIRQFYQIVINFCARSLTVYVITNANFLLVYNVKI
jgi:hypothetical protein